MTYAAVEIIKIKLPPDITEYYTVDNLQHALAAKLEPKVREFMLTGFGERRSSFLVAVAARLAELQSPRRTERAIVRDVTAAINELSSVHPDCLHIGGDDALSAAPEYEQYARLRHLTGVFKEDRAEDRKLNTRSLRKVLIREHLRTLNVEILRRPRGQEPYFKVVFRGTFENYADLIGELPVGVSIHNLDSEASIAAFTECQTRPAGVEVLIVGSAISAEQFKSLARNNVQLLVGPAGYLVNFKVESNTIPHLRVLQLDSDKPALLADLGSRYVYGLDAMEEAFVAADVKRDSFRPQIVADFNKAIRAFSELLVTEPVPATPPVEPEPLTTSD